MITKTAKEHKERYFDLYNRGQSGFLRALGSDVLATIGTGVGVGGLALSSGMLSHSTPAVDAKYKAFVNSVVGTSTKLFPQLPIGLASMLGSPFMANSAYRNKLRNLMGMKADRTDTAVENAFGTVIPIANGVAAIPAVATGVRHALSHPAGPHRAAQIRGGLAGTIAGAAPAIFPIAMSKLLQHWSRRRAENDFAEHQIKD